ncbi:1-acyl-sn-glycerol-3-phosphate acyltransferase beta-like isoform X3 [Lycorma delicatula]|uniref:1-acyl-sn-glycerol-3-phosphate acyltransferase beta-like isoform X3 n=1 Tax=Lycorma delicatula TaxID=130591 RepID=UPI003F5160C6
MILDPFGQGVVMLPQLSLNWLHFDFYLIPVIILLICLLPFASNHKVRYYGCFIVYIVLVSTGGIILIPIFLLRPLSVANSRLAGSFLKYITKLVGITWELRNGEILRVERGAVIVSNHQSMFDILGMFNLWEVMDRCAAIARKEIFYVWPFGLSAWLGGVVFIDRLNAKLANEKLFSISNDIFKNKIKMWIFPEGTRNKKRDTLLPFKRGAFRVAIQCKVPIIPVVFSPYYFINDEAKYFGQGKIIMTCLEAVSTEGLTENDIDSLMEKVRNSMVEQYEKSKQEALSFSDESKKLN